MNTLRLSIAIVVGFPVVLASVIAQPTWAPMGAPSGDFVYNVVVDSMGAYTAISEGGVYRREQNDSAWMRMGPPPPDAGSTLGACSIIATPSGQLLYRPVLTSGTIVYRSIDSGRTWQPTSIQSSHSSQSLPDAFALDPTTGAIYFSTEDTLVVTHDGGASWSVADPDRGGLYQLKVRGTYLYGVNDFESYPNRIEYRYYKFDLSDSALPWVEFDGRYAVEPRDFDVTSSGTVLVGAVEGMLHSTNDGYSWNWTQHDGQMEAEFEMFAGPDGPMAIADGGSVFRFDGDSIRWEGVGQIPDPARRSHVAVWRNQIVTTKRLGLAMSTDSGATWNYFAAGTSARPARRLYTAGDRMLYQADQAVYLTIDSGRAWTHFWLDGWATNEPVAMTLSPHGDVYTFVGSLLLRSMDDARSWDTISGSHQWPASTLAVRGDRIITEDHNPMTGRNKSGVSVSLDGGVTWVHRDGYMDSTAYDVAIDSTGGFIYADHDRVYYSSDDGASWDQANFGSTRSVVVDTNGTIYISSGPCVGILDPLTMTIDTVVHPAVELDIQSFAPAGSSGLVAVTSDHHVVLFHNHWTQVDPLEAGLDGASPTDVVTTSTGRTILGTADGRLFQSAVPLGVDRTDHAATDLAVTARQVGDDILVEISEPISGAADVTVFSIEGRRVFHRHLTVAAATRNLEINLGDVASGRYFVRLVHRGEAAIGSLVVVR